MPAVGSNNPRARDSSGTFKPWDAVHGKLNGSWQFAKRVYAKVSGAWVEVWNARPTVSSPSGTFASPVGSTTMSFSGQVDPNNFSTTTSFSYSGSGGTSGTVSAATVTGNGVNTVTGSAVIGNPFQNWTITLSGTNTVDTSTATTTNDCRQNTNGGSYNPSLTEYLFTGTCGNRQSFTRQWYTKSGCPTYYTDSTPVASPDCNAGCYNSPTTSTVVYSGSCGSRQCVTRYTYTPLGGTNCSSYYTDSSPYACPTCGTAGGACYIYENDEIYSNPYWFSNPFERNGRYFMAYQSKYTYDNYIVDVNEGICGESGPPNYDVFLNAYALYRCEATSPYTYHIVNLGCLVTVQ